MLLEGIIMDRSLWLGMGKSNNESQQK